MDTSFSTATVSSVSGSRRIRNPPDIVHVAAQFLFLRHQPVAAEAGPLCACNPDLAVDNRGARRGRDHSAAWDMKSKFCQAIRAAPRLEWDKATADGAGERAHGFHRGSPRGPTASFQPVSRRKRRMSQRHWSKLHPADIPPERFHPSPVPTDEATTLEPGVAAARVEPTPAKIGPPEPAKIEIATSVITAAGVVAGEAYVAAAGG